MLAMAGVGGVSGRGQHPVATAEPVRRLAERPRVPPGEADAASAGEHGACHGRADAPGAAGDEHDQAVQLVRYDRPVRDRRSEGAW
ncbi:hypothetical protein Ae406Ps2_0514c [Pseudonocardia sp. Ae406_Ps2]|nr:hypothetical protein Ae406Ps2_0514c [Pseudonocardia sp. Ae406_Ps2]OLM22086.1 hypothetical protein Ae706Ps2_0518c [Pseudonocardia sp. Ae706_Ps2]